MKQTKAYGVLLIPPLYLPESYGGAEQQTQRFASELLRCGIQASVYTVRQKPATSAREVLDGVPVTRVLLRAPAFMGGKHTYSLIKWSVALLVHLVRRRHEVKVVHIIHGKLHGVAAVLGARLLGMKTVAKLGRSGAHFDLDRVRQKKLYGRVCAWILSRGVDVFVANSREIRADLLRWGVSEARIATIPNGVMVSDETCEISAKGRELTLFVYAGRLDTEKAVDILLKSFARLQRKAWRLDILGDGECLADLKELAQSLGLTGNVAFHGAVPNVQDWFRQAEFYVSSSLSEGMSNSLLEAMSCGTIPLVTKVGGVADAVIDGECGLLVSPGDVEDFSRILERALDLLPAQRMEMSNRARNRMREFFSMHAVVQRHVAIYEKLLLRN